MIGALDPGALAPAWVDATRVLRFMEARRKIMPFDGTSYRRNDALGKIDAVIELLRTEDRWCKGALKNLMGQRCLMGAMQEASALILKPYILTSVREVTGKNFHTIESFNDRRSTTHAQVLEVLYHARGAVAVDCPLPAARAATIRAWCRSVAEKCRSLAPV